MKSYYLVDVNKIIFYIYSHQYTFGNTKHENQRGVTFADIKQL